MQFYVSPTVGNFVYVISAFLVHSTSFSPSFSLPVYSDECYEGWDGEREILTGGMPVKICREGRRRALWTPFVCWFYQSPRAHLHVEGMLQFMSDINQPSLPTPFYSVLVSISVFMALSAVNSPFSDCSSSLISALLVISTTYLLQPWYSP